MLILFFCVSTFLILSVCIDQWGVTATPFEKFGKICQKFGVAVTAANRNIIGTWNKIVRSRSPTPQQIDRINTWMIRHTKNQMIAGTAALKLPAMPKSTIMVETTSKEKQTYLNTRSKLDVWNVTKSYLSRKNIDISKLPSASYLDIQLHPLRSQTCCNSKLLALEKDISTLLHTQNGHANVLIFTRFMDSIATLRKFRSKSIVMSKMKIYEISSNSAAKARQSSIRSFQDPSNKQSKILIVSYRTGSCGITLTAASRVYLLEPCLLPSDEVQAGGRISRLGQTKKISLVRLVMKDTCDEGLIKLHAMLESGAAKYDNDGKLPPVLIPTLLKEGAAKPPSKNNIDNKAGTALFGVNIWQAIYKLPVVQQDGTSADAHKKNTELLYSTGFT